MQLTSQLAKKIPTSLTNFDTLPDSAYIRLPVVKALFGISSASVWRAVKSGAVPKPHKITERTTAWLVSDIRASLASKAV